MRPATESERRNLTAVAAEVWTDAFFTRLLGRRTRASFIWPAANDDLLIFLRPRPPRFHHGMTMLPPAGAYSTPMTTRSIKPPVWMDTQTLAAALDRQIRLAAQEQWWRYAHERGGYC